MIRKLRIYISLVAITCGCQASAQLLLDRVTHPLSPQEDRSLTDNVDISLSSSCALYANPVFTEWRNSNDTMLRRRMAIVYAGLASGDGKGDFIPYEGDGSSDYRVGAYGEYTTPRSGTLSGSIQYAQGEHRNIGWSAMRLPELYFPYISTDSCGGDFKFDSYYAEGNYALKVQQWVLGVKGSFYGEQAYRLSDPRALNNTTWLRFNMGAARDVNGHLLMLDWGYGRNKQHMQLRYWRPGQQDRFFVCYGFGLYDTRQSGVSFGKSRMYYVDEYNARLQYLSPQRKKLRFHASLAYAYQHMETEESDIYNLYESCSHHLTPMLSLAYDPKNSWRFELMVQVDLMLRKSYENIIEEYLIDNANNIYDFRTIDTRQNYSRNTGRMEVALRTAKNMGRFELSLQGGIATDRYDEKYKIGDYRINVRRLTSHIKAGVNWQGSRNALAFNLVYARQRIGSHDYHVQMQNQKITHLDFQHAFAPYAYRTANLHKFIADVTWQHQLKSVIVGIKGKAYLANGHRLENACYTDVIGFPSTAPMISAYPDKHNEQWGSTSFFVMF